MNQETGRNAPVVPPSKPLTHLPPGAFIGHFETRGAIREKWIRLGGEQSFLGHPLANECTTPDGIGRYNHFQNGSIYWHPGIGALEVHGAIREKWASLGWEQGFLGYPLTDESTTPDGIGRYNHFQGGSIYWHPDIGVFEVHGAIRDKWSHLGWERGFLGYPVSDETAAADGVSRRSDFQHGVLFWHPNLGTIATPRNVPMKPCGWGGPEGDVSWQGDWDTSWASPTGWYRGRMHIDVGGMDPYGYFAATGTLTFLERPGDYSTITGRIGLNESQMPVLGGQWNRVKGLSGGAVQYGQLRLDLYADLGVVKFGGYWTYGDNVPGGDNSYLWGGAAL